jgi:hypothetical protein
VVKGCLHDGISLTIVDKMQESRRLPVQSHEPNRAKRATGST